jgi:large conductance mechanosensitive channel
MEAPLNKAGSLWSEFKAFAFKGNMIDLAIAVVIGGAFGPVIKSVVDDIIMPIANLPFKHLGGTTPGYENWHIGDVKFGLVLAALLNFVIVALAVFICVVKVQQLVMGKIAPPAPSEPVSKECPKCLSTIPIKATRCAHCCSDLATA